MRALAISFLIILFAAPAHAGDREQLQQLLEEFLAGAAGDAAVHQRFWADDLIYTSSSGKRFGKAVIMQGLAEAKGQPVTASYSAEEVDIRLFGETAVVAFKLVGEDRSAAEAVTSRYFNTGTFVKRDGNWRAVAWQATKIPAAEQ
ncbi:nuclear transport factor 2 family protein [Microbulbifer magnicolonia]|uniref:nuclear transport factor 2 family protein n=1 Tax=Microbulbifer magnicolonia TaxID=3109744 RepID=UPI002B4176D5|nr:nuclear transport factor 2 family protein [Microbulbifer sp. GG15]